MGISKKAVVKGKEILEYIPQRGKIVMVDAFYGEDGSCSESGLTVAEDNMFAENGVLKDVGIIEHIAQSAALRVGYLCKLQGKEIPVGFIGAVSKFSLDRLPKVGVAIRTRIKVEQEVMNITLISAGVSVESREIARCQMKIFLNQ